MARGGEFPAAFSTAPFSGLAYREHPYTGAEAANCQRTSLAAALQLAVKLQRVASGHSRCFQLLVTWKVNTLTNYNRTEQLLGVWKVCCRMTSSGRFQLVRAIRLLAH